MKEEINRLGQIFDTDDDNSMLNRWMNGAAVTTSAEFDELLWTALEWQRCSGGVFNVSTRRLQLLWERAAAEGCQPSPGELHEVALDIATAPYRFDGHRLRQIRNCRDLDLDAITDGFVVDLATDAAWRMCDLNSLAVSVRGKIVHRGESGLDVARSDRFRTARAPTLQNTALATFNPGSPSKPGSGPTGRVFDPRTGQQTTSDFSITVVAPNATTAGAVATILSVITPDQRQEFVDALNARSPARHPAVSFMDVISGPVEYWIVDPRSDARHSRP